MNRNASVWIIVKLTSPRNSVKHNILNLNNERNSLRAISPIKLSFDQQRKTVFRRRRIFPAKAFGKLNLIWRINLFSLSSPRSHRLVPWKMCIKQLESHIGKNPFHTIQDVHRDKYKFTLVHLIDR